ncbi:MAG: gliding motility protein GldL [Bacteroidales bacterium]|nr:gliding motility protein GldL [Bacteroidales bacterium]
MAAYSKYNLVYRLQKWMDSVPGQTFLNYAYSWGASVVILGALFKITHVPGANFWLFLGMGTEVFVFFISAFDRPFDKTADGRDLPTHYVEETETVDAPMGQAAGCVEHAPQSVQMQPVQGVVPVQVGAMPPLEDQQAMADAQGAYVEELKKLVETLGKVNEQSARLATDSEEMENLNRTLTGISRVYEMQLKSASQQIVIIDQINEQSKQMARYIEQLNKIYARMIQAMTVNMRTAAPSQSTNFDD